MKSHLSKIIGQVAFIFIKTKVKISAILPPLYSGFTPGYTIVP